MKKTFTTILATAALLTATPMTARADNPDNFPLKYDLNLDRKIDSVDASMVLAEYASISTGGEGNFTVTQLYTANCDENKKIDSVDASNILKIYTKNSSGEEVPKIVMSFEAWVYHDNTCDYAGEIYTYEEAYEIMMGFKNKLALYNKFEKAMVQVMYVEYTELKTIRTRTVYVERAKAN